jgi:hypothetical protein
MAVGRAFAFTDEAYRERTNRADTAKHGASLRTGTMSETSVTAWIRMQGHANQMTLVLNDEVNISGNRVCVVHCDPCGTDIRTVGTQFLHKHVNSARHAAALQPGLLPESKMTAWIREHGGANQMTVVSSDEVSNNGRRVWVTRCDACATHIHAVAAQCLQHHANSARHAAALQPGTAPESGAAAWIREHGATNQMTFVSNDEVDTSGKRVWVIHCTACGRDVRGSSVARFRKHADCAEHAAALEGGRLSPAAQRKRSRS